VLTQDSATTFLFGWGNWKTIASTHILSEINAGRPIVLATGSNINGTGSNPNVRDFDHAVIAYGHQTFAAYSGSGNNTSYLGYIVHMGWDANGGAGTITNIWTNSAWYYGYISLRTTHAHNHNNYIGGNNQEVRCNGCGHREVAYTFSPSSATTTTLTGVRAGINITGTANILEILNGRTVTHIGNSAFAYATNLHGVSIPASVTHIGNEAFRGSALVGVAFEVGSNLLEIGEEAFRDCILLIGLQNMPASIRRIGKDALMNTMVWITAPNNSIVTHGGWVFGFKGTAGSTLTINNGTKGISDSAFANQTALTSVSIPTSVEHIGKNAFFNTGIWNNAGSNLVFAGNWLVGSRSLTSNVHLPWGTVGIADHALEGVIASAIVIDDSVVFIGVNAFAGASIDFTIYTSRTSRPIGWTAAWNSTNKSVIWGCILQLDSSTLEHHVVSFTKTANNPSQQSEGGSFSNHIRRQHTFGGWFTNSNFTGTRYLTLEPAPNVPLFARYDVVSCIAQGSLITLYDGSQVAVESLTGNELLLVWNHNTGNFDTAPIIFIDSDPLASFEIIHLFFSDGTDVKVIYEHAFFNTTLNKYVFFRDGENIQYIGNYFNKQTTDAYGNLTWESVQLTDIQIYYEYTTAWSPVTFSHLNFYVNGMLSMPGATEGLINIFEVNPTTLQYCQAQYLADIQTYGLFCYYTSFEHLIPIEVFYAFNVQYLKVSIGKGLITWEGIMWLIDYYGGFWN
jgi:hypothetical protein